MAHSLQGAAADGRAADVAALLIVEWRLLRPRKISREIFWCLNACTLTFAHAKHM